MQNEDPNFYFRLLSGNPAAQRAVLRLLQAFAIALLVLHVSIAASVMPYVYVDDSLANCGARMVLRQFQYDIEFIFVVLVTARIFIFLYRLMLPWFLPQRALATGVDQRILAFFGLISALLIGASFAAYGKMIFDDLKFLSTPPVIRKYSAVCPEVDWVPNPDGRAPQAATQSPALVAGIPFPRSSIDLRDPAGGISTLANCRRPSTARCARRKSRSER